MKLLYLILAGFFYSLTFALIMLAAALGWIGAEFHNGGKYETEEKENN